MISPLQQNNGLIRGVNAANAQPTAQGFAGIQPTGGGPIGGVTAANVQPTAQPGGIRPVMGGGMLGLQGGVQNNAIQPQFQRQQIQPQQGFNANQNGGYGGSNWGGQQQQGMFGLQQLMQMLMQRQQQGGYQQMGGYGGGYQQGPQQPQWASGYQPGYGQPSQSLTGGMNTQQYRMPQSYYQGGYPQQGGGMPFGMMPQFNAMQGMYGNSRSQFGY